MKYIFVTINHEGFFGSSHILWFFKWHYIRTQYSGGVNALPNVLGRAIYFVYIISNSYRVIHCRICFPNICIFLAYFVLSVLSKLKCVKLAFFLTVVLFEIDFFANWIKINFKTFLSAKLLVTKSHDSRSFKP